KRAARDGDARSLRDIDRARRRRRDRPDRRGHRAGARADYSWHRFGDHRPADMIAGPFPENFLWGTATAAHQVEGGNRANDWWAPEQIPGRIKNADTSDRACEHFGRYASDFDLLRSLNQNAHRLSVEWSRIEPAPGEFSRTALA